jgi:hypothetical protein
VDTLIVLPKVVDTLRESVTVDAVIVENVKFVVIILDTVVVEVVRDTLLIVE